MVFVGVINFLLPKFLFPSIIEIYLKIGSYHLLICRRGAQRKFYPLFIPSYFRIEISAIDPYFYTIGIKWLHNNNC